MADNKKNITRQLSIFINDKQVVNSLTGIGAAIRKTNHELRGLNQEDAEYDEKLKDLSGRLKDLKAKQSEMTEEIYGTTTAVKQQNAELGSAKNAFTNLFNGFKNGDFEMIKNGFTGLKSGIGETVKAGWALAATPLGATIAVLAGIALAAKEWFNYNNEAAKATKIVSQITKLTGEQADATRVNAQVIAKTFDQDFNEVLETARALVNEFGVSYEEAFERIENGLVKGGAANGEFLESMREYPTFFANAGYSIEEFQNLVNSGIDLGIYQDKLPDAIKEFSLSVKEQTPAVREALQNAFGEEFTNKLLKGVKDGSLDVKNALIQVSEEAKRLGLNSQQAQQLTADLFRGAGEDAGGALKIFEAVSKSIENQKRPLNEVEQATQDLLQSEKELAEAQESALRSEGFDIWKNRALIALNSITKAFYDTVAVITNSREQLEAIATKNANVKIIKENTDAALKEFESFLKKAEEAAGKNFNLEEATQNYVATMQDSLKRAIAEKDELEAASIRAEIKAIEEAAAKRTEISNKNNIDDIKARTAANKARLKEIDAQHKKEMDADRKALEDWSNMWIKANDEINDLIYKSQAERSLDKLKGLDKEIKQVENKWAVEREKYKDHVDRLAEIDAAKDEEVQALKAAKAVEYGLQIDEINAQLERDREALRLDKEAEQASTDEEKQLILLEKAKMLADWEIETERDKELAKVEDVENAEELKQAIRDKYALKKAANDKKFGQAEKEIKSDVVDWTKLTEDQKLELIKNALNMAAEAFNKGSGAWKAAKIAETAITTYQTAMKSYNAFADIPIIGPALGIAAAGLATATGIKQIQQIQKTKIEKAPKFFKGGFTGSTAIGHDEYGKVTGYVHDEEYVVPKAMTRNKRYANVLGWMERERRTIKGYFDGGNTTSGSDAAVQVLDGAAAGDNDIRPLLSALLYRLDNPVSPVLAIGYQDIKNINSMNDDLSQSSRNGTLNNS